MLQQTTVAAVVGFFERWMNRFPSVLDLADAPMDEVLRFWAGLGYYTRARNIKRTAEIVAHEFGGRFPETAAELVKLPGVGRYTAGAIASIAFNTPAPILDTNVLRVLCRLAAISGDTGSTAVRSELWSLAERSIPAGNARDFNQALMELGALICSPREPNCGACPASRWCAGAARGNPESFPPPRAPKSWKSARHVAVAIERDGNLLVVKRPDSGVWAGLWEMPRVIVADGESSECAARRAAAETLGLLVEPSTVFGCVKHVVMDVKITLTGVRAELGAGSEPSPLAVESFAWAGRDELSQYAVASPQRRLMALWAGQSRD